MKELKEYVRTVPDFPKPGIAFYDITTLFGNPKGFKMALDAMEKFISEHGATKIVAVEARGFILGGALADRLDIPCMLARKPEKLPYKTILEKYELEYGSDTLEMHIDAVEKGDKVAIVDDLIATGGTLKATAKLVERSGGEVVAISSIIALPFLPFEKELDGYNVQYLITYESE